MEYENSLQHIADTSERLNIQHLYELSALSPAELDRFREVWPTIEDSRRRVVMRHLVELAEYNFSVDFDPIFLLGMGDEDSEVRATAIEGLWENEDQALVGPLVFLLRSDETVTVRAAAANALGRFVLLGELDQIDSAPAMLAEQSLLETIHLQGEDLEVRRRAIESIAYSSEAGVREIIEAAYYHEDERMQASALFAMGRSADPHWAKLILAELESVNPELRFEAARACGELEMTPAVSHLAGMIVNDPDREVQQMAVEALGRIGGGEARKVLEACYEDEDEVLSQAAAEALDQMDFLGESLDLPLFEEFEDFDEYE